MQFVVIAAPRTGSTHLTDFLRRQPRVHCHGEVFARSRVLYSVKGGRTSELDRDLLALRESDSEAFLDRIYAMDNGQKNVGFKIFQGHNDVALARLVEDPTVRKVLLNRRNMLAAYSSSLASKKTGVWGTKQRSDAVEKPKVRFRPDGFVKFHDRRVQFHLAWVTRIAQSGQQFHWIEYEDLNEPVKLASLLAFVGGNAAGYKSTEPVARRPATDVCARFENAGEVEAFLHRHGLMHWAFEAETALQLLGTPPAAEGKAA